MTSAIYTQPVRGFGLPRLGPYLAASGATLGVLAGLVELTVGPQIRSWIGNKQDTTRLGIATIALSTIALAAAANWYRRNHPSTGARLLVIVMLVVPGAIGFTTVGRAWYIPGTLLLLAAAIASLDLRKNTTHVLATISRNWMYLLITVLAAFYILLGATALGGIGALGILGGIATITLIATSARIPKRIAVLALIAAMTPFAVLTWWSVVTPLLAILVLAFGPSARWRAAAPSEPA